MISHSTPEVIDSTFEDFLSEFVAEGFRIVSFISSEAKQVTGITPGDLRAGPRVVFLSGCPVDVSDVQYFCGHKSVTSAVECSRRYLVRISTNVAGIHDTPRI
jgi:hypothetical protein